MDASAQAIRCLGIVCLGIDRAEAHQTTKRRLDVTARATKPVIKIEMAKGGVEIVAPHQDHDPAAKPNAFRVSGRTIDGLRCLNEFVGFALTFLGHIGRRGRIWRGRFSRLILGAKVAALGDRASDTDQECKPGDGEVAQNRIFKLKHPSTHKFPDLFPARRQPDVLV